MTLTLLLPLFTLGLCYQGAEPATAHDYYERAMQRQAKKDYDGALQDYAQAIRLDPQFVAAYFSRAGLYGGRDDMENRDYQKAVDDLSMVLKLQPQDFGALRNRALYWQQLGKFDEAIADYERLRSPNVNLSHLHDPNSARAYGVYEHAKLLSWYKRDQVKAIEHFHEALGLHANLAKDQPFYWHLGLAHQRAKDYVKADAAYVEGLKLDPEYPKLLCARALIMAACPDASLRNGAEAMKLANQACDISKHAVAEHLAVLAAAYAETGDFQNATKTQKRALERLAGKRGQALKPELEQRLKLYEAAKPYRLP